MADFYQTGVISTLHRYPNGDKLEKMEADLKKVSRQQPATPLLPSLWSEFEGPAMPKIVEQLRSVKYLRQIVLVLDSASPETCGGRCSSFVATSPPRTSQPRAASGYAGTASNSWLRPRLVVL